MEFKFLGVQPGVSHLINVAFHAFNVLRVFRLGNRLGLKVVGSWLAAWIRREDLAFEALIGGSLGGMVALELALLIPERFRTVGVIGCGARADAWLWGANAIQRAILASATLGDAEAIAESFQAERHPVGND